MKQMLIHVNVRLVEFNLDKFTVGSARFMILKSEEQPKYSYCSTNENNFHLVFSILLKRNK